MRSILTFIIPLLLLFSTLGTYADGGAIVLSSSRVTIEPRQRTATITLTNRTTQKQHYRTSIIDMVMDSHGVLSKIDDDTNSHDHSANQWVIATPALIRLEPGESQNIRLLIRRPKDLTEGEYRVHLNIAQQPSADIAGGLQEESSKEGGLRFNISTVYAVNTPIFIRQGQINTTASIARADLVDDGKRIIFTLERAGNGSFRGFVQARAGNVKPLNMSIVIYPERDQINVSRDMGTLIDSAGAITLSLYQGSIPREGEALTETLDTFTVSR